MGVIVPVGIYCIYSYQQKERNITINFINEMERHINDGHSSKCNCKYCKKYPHTTIS